MTSQITIYLNLKQYKKLQSNKTIQLKIKDLQDDSNKHEVELQVTPAFAKKYHRAVNSTKGLRLKNGVAEILGGSILSSATNLAKSVPRSFVRDVIKYAGKEATKKFLPKNLHGLSSSIVDLGLQSQGYGQGSGILSKMKKVAKVVPKSIVRDAVKLAVNEGAKRYLDEDMSKITNQVVDYGLKSQGYGQNGSSIFGKIARTVGKEAGKRYIPKEYQNIGNTVLDLGLKSQGYGLKKGSPEMKAKMAALRARRTGTGFKPLGSGIQPYQMKVGGSFLPL